MNDYQPSAKEVKALRDRTGAGMMDCKAALLESGGEIEQATDLLRIKGAADAAKRSGREAREGIIDSYIHTGGRVGVLVEVNCETDFVARSDDFTTFVHDVALHIAAMNPQFVSADEVSDDYKARERAVYLATSTASAPCFSPGSWCAGWSTRPSAPCSPACARTPSACTPSAPRCTCASSPCTPSRR